MNNEPFEPFLLILGVLIVLLMVAVFAFGLHEKKKRTQAVEQIAMDMGGSFQESDPPFLESIKGSGLHLFQRGHSRSARNLLRVPHRDTLMTAFDYRFITGHGKHRHRHHQTAVLFSWERGGLPLFVLRPQNLLDNIAAGLGMQDINFEENPAFSHRYHLSGSDEEAIRRVFGGAALEYCAERERLVVESCGDRLLIYRYRHLVKPDEMHEFIEEARWLFDLLRPRV